ncbi:MAG TPA: hypothetical protein VFU35_06750, partial [Jatrophihabitans sp.]|nr:hypothetical protein [Jatrophihabitans sp.]
VPGLRLHPRPPFALRLDLSGARPQLRVHLRIGERLAHELVDHLHKHQHVKVVNTIRERVGGPVRQALAAALHRLLARRDITLPEGASARIADALAEAIARSVAHQLPAAAAALTAAAKDPAPGVTLTFGFAFADKAALVRGHIGDPTLSIHPGVVHRD